MEAPGQQPRVQSRTEGRARIGGRSAQRSFVTHVQDPAAEDGAARPSLSTSRMLSSLGTLPNTHRRGQLSLRPMHAASGASPAPVARAVPRPDGDGPRVGQKCSFILFLLVTCDGIGTQRTTRCATRYLRRRACQPLTFFSHKALSLIGREFFL
jgi:hypothetical protein